VSQLARTALLILATLAAAAALATRASPDTMLLGGLGATRGLGELSPAPEASLCFASRRVAVEAGWYGAAKIESGAGWGARGAAEMRWRGLGVGASYAYRDGGDWVKHYPWARVSVGMGPVRLIGEVALGGVNSERRVELRWTTRRGWLAVEPRWWVTQHVQGTGFGAALLLGIAGGRHR
jgi:hypothetical protein